MLHVCRFTVAVSAMKEPQISASSERLCLS